ncbi:ABC transporter permease [Actinoallomurus vinaceus]|uniref:Transport permease protein n=1 Tax=Actinoallomurus vinaceus TaxID=1080074 RepID=A0ABP8U4H6_9ACTN
MTAVVTARCAAELRAARMVWLRELLHFVRGGAASLVSLLQPLLFLFVLGIGLARMFAGAGGGHTSDYLMFLFPGVLVMAAQPPAISVGASIVWDRQSGFLREMLVSPVRRGTLLTGKCLGGATVATCQGMIVLACGGLVHLPYRLGLVALLSAELALTGLAMTLLGAMVAVTIRRPRTFSTVLGVLMTPLVFLSGLMFPVSAMPGWMAWAALADPLTYAVDAMRQTIAARARPSSLLFQPVAWGGWHPPPLAELGVVAAFIAICLAVSAHRFSRLD